MFAEETTKVEPDEWRPVEETEPCALPVDALEDELAQLATHMNAGMCRWLELVAEFDRRGDWGVPGCSSCARWLSWRCAVLPSEAREHVRVARALSGVPAIQTA